MSSWPFLPTDFNLGSRVELRALVFMLLIAVPASADWPQWRGPDGLGVSPGSYALPESWGPDSANIRWRTPIPGEGISSPIVSNGRVFVTTAYKGSRSERLDLAIRTATVVLALTFFLFIATRLRRASSPGGVVRTLTRKPISVDSLIVLTASFAFLLLAVVMALRPELFLEDGNPGRSWRVGSAFGLLGLAAAFSWFKGDSRWRLAGVAILLPGAGLLAYLYPSSKLGPVGPTKILILALPALAASYWFIVNFRRVRKNSRSSHIEGIYNPLLALPLILLSALVFVQPNFLNGLERVVLCFDLESGELLWERTAFSAPAEQKWPKSTYATPTPATDGKGVFAYFGSGIASVDFEGRLEWKKRFREYSKHTRYGAAASPIVTADSVIIVQESEMYQDAPSSWIAAFDKKSGRPLWRVNPPEARDSYATPILYRSPSSTQLLAASWEILLAYDVDSGERLWSHEYPMQQVVASVGRSGNLLAITGGTVGERALVLMRLESDGTETKAEVLWEARRGVATISSPVIYDGKVFTVTDSGIMTCYDADTGTVLWKQRLDGKYFSSLIAGDGKVYATNTEGSTTVITSDSPFKVLAVNKLGDEVYASPAIADGGILVRTAHDLFFIEREDSGGHLTSL